MFCADETGLHMTRTAVLVVLGMVRRVDWTKAVVIIRLLPGALLEDVM